MDFLLKQTHDKDIKRERMIHIPSVRLGMDAKYVHTDRDDIQKQAPHSSPSAHPTNSWNESYI